jgi:hypothetical protein
MTHKLENFREAFSPPFGTIVVLCECGTIYFDAQDSSCFEDGQLEGYLANPKAVAVSEGTGWVNFEGNQYCWHCTCWHTRAEKIMGFIDAHANGIAGYLTRERKRRFEEANSSPVVQGAVVAMGAGEVENP